MHFVNGAALAAVLFTTLIQNLRPFFFRWGWDCS